MRYFGYVSVVARVLFLAVLAGGVAAPAQTTVGNQRTIDPTLFGQHTLSPTRHWPTIPLKGMRPAGTAWANVETSRGVYSWGSLDTWVAAVEQHQADLVYLFLKTPSWASSNPTQSCYAGNVGCAAPPSDFAYWEEFVTAVVTRYKGRIKYYELWNEPNSNAYWTGSIEQMVEMARRAYPIIKRIDPNAEVLTPSPSATGWPTHYGEWMDTYLRAGGYRYADAAAWHGYMSYSTVIPVPMPDVGTSPACTSGLSCPGSIQTQVSTLRAAMDAGGMAGKPLWNTEGGWGRNTQIPNPDDQIAFITRWYILNAVTGVQRAYWYQWDNENWGTLWTSTGGATAAATAYAELHQWLTGSTLQPCQVAAAVWSCNLTDSSGKAAQMVWSTDGTRSYTPPAEFDQYTDLAGITSQVTGGTITIGAKPLVLRSSGTGGLPPVASIAVTPETGYAPLSITADSSASYAQAGTKLSRSIDFGDGTVVQDLVTASHQYDASGDYTVSVRVTDEGGRSSTASARVRVNAVADFSLAASSPVTVKTGKRTSVSLTVSSSGGYGGTVSLSAAGAPPGVATSFDSASVLAPGAATLRVEASSTAVPGTYTLTVVGSDGTLSRSAVVSLVIETAPGDLSMSATPKSRKIRTGQTGTYSISLAPVGGRFDSSVQLSCSGLPSNGVCTFSPASVIPGDVPATTNLTVSFVTGVASRRQPQWPFYATFALPFVGVVLIQRCRKTRQLLALAVLGALLVITQPGCGGGAGQADTTTGGQTGQSTTYSIVVIGTSGSIQRSTTVELTVE